MAPDVASLSLIDHLAEAGFRSSVIATYSCYFPFYEEVVFPRLRAAGCTHNILMADATRCAEAFADDELRPRRAGRDYTLIPVKVGGAFHPKIFLRLGKTKGTLLVGSHNVTLSGFGLNDEVTNIFRVEGSTVRSGGTPLRRAFDYLASFVPSGLAELVEAYEGVKAGVPWMDGPLGMGDPDRLLLTASAGPDLWSQVVPLVPEGVATAFVCGPFFDSPLAFLRRLQSDVRPRRMIVGIDPLSAELDAAAATRLPDVRWVNVAGVMQLPHRREGSSHYLHAKLLWFQSASQELLIAGSANPSVAAFLAPEATRNAEAVVADRRPGAGTAIGIAALLSAPPITATEWRAVAERRAASPETGAEMRRRIWVATPTQTGFLVQDPLPQDVILRGIGDNAAVLGEAAVCGAAGTTIDAPEPVVEGARYLEAAGSAEHLVVVVHRTEDIARNLGGDTRKALRKALGALEEDPSQLDTLLKLTEKVIFDSDDVVRTTTLRPVPARETGNEQAVATGSLALDAAGRRPARRRRSLASGDIVVLLDALMRRLGEGLPATTSSRTRNDQDEIGVDEEDGGELTREVPDFEVLATACRGKTRRLIKRMEGQFKLAGEHGKARRAVVQLAAVLGVVRSLRQIGQRPEWRRRQLDLVARDDERYLFKSAVLAIAWGPEPLAQRAVAEADGDWFDELSIVVGLLAWLAWDVEVTAEEIPKAFGQTATNDRWGPVSLFASLGPWFDGDDSAAVVLEEGVSRTPRFQVDGDRWLRTHRALLESYSEIAAAPDGQGQKGRRPRPGDLVVLGNGEAPRVRVVVDVEPASSTDKVIVFDPTGTQEKRSFYASRVATLPWVPFLSRTAGQGGS